jgi:hypothetical protein
MTAATVHWADAAGHEGQYPASTPLKTDKSLPDAKHAGCGWVVTSYDADKLARVAAAMRGAA